MRHMIATFCNDTLAGMDELIRNDHNFAGAKPLVTMMKNLAGIFMGIVVCPKMGPKNVKIYDMNHPAFKQQSKHLQWFITAQIDNQSRWLPPVNM